jgi:hypothetical protein
MTTTRRFLAARAGHVWAVTRTSTAVDSAVTAIYNRVKLPAWRQSAPVEPAPRR